MKLPLYKFVLSFALVLFFGSFTFAQNEREQGIELYKNGNYKAAITTLKEAVSQNSKDLTASHYLGLSLEKDNQIKQAIKIFNANIDNALKMIAETLEEKLGGIRRENDKETIRDYLQRRIGSEINSALESGQRFEELNSKEATSDKWQTKILALRFFTQNVKATEKNNTEKSNAVSVRITNKPFPSYTDSARANRTNGTIRLWTLFLSNGRIGLVVPLNRLPDGLTESALNAAKDIRFEPATRDGKAVSVVKQIEYSFTTF